MKTYEEFTHFCSSRLNSELELLQTERGEVVRKLVIFRSILVLMVLGFLGMILSVELLIESIENSTIVLILTVIIFISYVSLFFYIFSYQRKIKETFVQKFKTTIISAIVKFFDDNLTYQHNRSISYEEFSNSGLINRRIDKYYGDDYVEGNIGQTSIKFSEVHAFIEEKSDKKSHYVEVFGGIFFIGDFNKNFNGRTYIFPDKLEQSFGRFTNFLQSLIRGHGELIKLEDLEFEKEFAVYSDDQIEARYILSTSLMQRILEFKRKAKSEIMMAFKSSKIYIAIPMKGRLFEPKIFGKLIAVNTLRKYYEDLSITISAVEDLNLNLRIWSKQ